MTPLANNIDAPVFSQKQVCTTRGKPFMRPNATHVLSSGDGLLRTFSVLDFESASQFTRFSPSDEQASPAKLFDQMPYSDESHARLAASGVARRA